MASVQYYVDIVALYQHNKFVETHFLFNHDYDELNTS